MKSTKGFRKEVIKANTAITNVDFSGSSIKSTVDVSPLNRGGTNFKTHVLVEESSSKLAYSPSRGVGIFSFLFLAVGLGVLFFNFFPFTGTNGINWFLLIFGGVFAAAGSIMFYSFYKPRVFDKQLGIYYKAYNVTSKHSKKNSTPLKSIIAVQIIGEHVRSDKGTYKSFELNLVLHNGDRKNVVDHGNLKSIIDDAHIISEFLNVPIWHAKSSEKSDRDI